MNLDLEAIKKRADTTFMQMEWLDSHIDDDDGLPEDALRFFDTDVPALVAEVEWLRDASNSLAEEVERLQREVTEVAELARLYQGMVDKAEAKFRVDL